VGSNRVSARSGALALSGPPEGTQAQVEKDRHDPSRYQEEAVVGAVEPTGSCAPERRSEDQHRQEEEDPRYLEPENAANPLKRPQKAANTAHDSSRRAAGFSAVCFHACRGAV